MSSAQSVGGVASEVTLDLDPVSLVVVPHLDRIYVAMGRLCVGREGDPHKWVNPEFHGWSAGRGFAINVDVATGNSTISKALSGISTPVIIPITMAVSR